MLRSLLVCLFTLLAGVAQAVPNIIVIMADDLTQQAISAYGSNIYTSVATTPNIDRIATAGVRFTNSFVTNSICVPSRATLLTGKYSNKNGTFENSDVFNGAQQTMPKLLDAAGYQTAIMGKWMIGGTPTGFDYFDIVSPSTEDGIYTDPPMTVCDACVGAGTTTTRPGYFTTLLTGYATDWLDAAKGDAGPFALFIQHKGPHAEFVPAAADAALYSTDFAHPTTYDDDLTGRSLSTQDNGSKLYPDLFNRWNGAAFQAVGKDTLTGATDALKKEAVYQAHVKDYLRTLKGVDDSVGTILDYLAANSDENGLLSTNTIVIFTSDNGYLLGEHGLFNKLEPYEEVLRVPLLMSGPGITAGAIEENFVLNTDLAPTILDAADVAIPSDMDGASLLDLIDGSVPAGWRTSFYYQTYDSPAANPTVQVYALRTSRYKLIHHYGQEWAGDPDWELIDLHEDPNELTNVYDDANYQSVIPGLKGELYRQRSELGIRTSITGGTQSGVTIK